MKTIKKRNTCFVMLFCLIILAMTGCSNKNTISKSENKSESLENSIETGNTKNEISNKIVAKVFENKEALYDVESQKYIYLREYKSTNFMDYDDSGKYEYENTSKSQDENQKIVRWCELDMDSDGEKEILVEYSSSNILVLHDEEGIVYGYAFPFRGMNSIKTDGSFTGTDSAATTYIGKIKFIGKECFYEEMCVKDELNKDKSIYRIKGQLRTKKEVNEYIKEQEKKEDILWNNILS